MLPFFLCFLFVFASLLYTNFQKKEQLPHSLGHTACTCPSSPHVQLQCTKTPHRSVVRFEDTKLLYPPPAGFSWGSWSEVGVQYTHSHGVGTWRAAPTAGMSNTIVPLVPLVQSLGAWLVLPNPSCCLIRTVRLGYSSPGPCLGSMASSLPQWQAKTSPACRDCGPIGEGCNGACLSSQDEDGI